MKEYIERQAVIDELLKSTIITSDLYGMGIMSGLDFAVKKVANAPAADVAEVRHERWEDVGNNIRVCTGCRHGIKGHMACVNKFCPNCGAKMDKEET